MKKASSKSSVEKKVKSKRVSTKTTSPAVATNVMKSNETVILNNYFKILSGLHKLIKRNIEKRVHTLLLGPTGVGKTELVSNIAKDLGKPITIFDMGTMTDPIMSLVGSHIIKPDESGMKSTFVPSRFSEVIQKPGVVLLDELSRASAGANNLLFPCLDFRAQLAMEYSFENNEPINVHPECVFFATANLGSQYTGTHKLDKALLSRFMTIEIDPLSLSDTKEAIKLYSPSLPDTVISKAVDLYFEINQMHDNYTISFNLSLRDLKQIVDMVVDGFTLYDSFYITTKGIGGKEGLKAIENILNTKL